MDILNEDERGREAHQISFTARMVETMRILLKTRDFQQATHID